MLKDFELEQRYLKAYQTTKNKWKSENKRYLEKVEHMKEKKEENYNTRRSNLIKEFNRKQKEIEKQLYKIRESKEGERTKLINMMLKKEILAQEKKKNKEKNEEDTRKKYETQIFSKCNNYIYNLYLIYF